MLFNFGMTYLHADREFEVAAQYLRRSLARCHWNDSIVRKAFAMLTTCRICQGDWHEAIAVNEAGREHYPDDAELLFQAGQLYQQVHRFDQGRLCLERLVHGQDDAYYRSVDVGLRTYRGWQELALLFRRMGDGAHCAEVLENIARHHPDYLPAQVDLAETLALMGRKQQARELARRIPEVRGVARVRELTAA